MGGLSPVLFVFSLNRKGGTLMFVSSTLRGVCSLLFSFCFRCFFAVRSSTCFVYCSGVLSVLTRSGFLLFFLVVRCLSDCLPPLFFFHSRGPVHSCLFLLAWSLYISLFAFFPSSLSLSTLWSLLPLSWGFLFFSFFAVGSGILSYTLCSPFFAAVARPCTNSGFPVSLACSVLLPLSLGILFFLSFRLSVFFFSPVGLLYLGFRLRIRLSVALTFLGHQ